MRDVFLKIYRSSICIGAYCVFLYFTLLLTVVLFSTLVNEYTPAVWVFFVMAIPAYSLFYMLPTLLVTLIALLFGFRKGKEQLLPAIIVVTVSGFITHLLLLADFGLYRNFSFHFNALILNLLLTPGGFASMGLRTETVITLLIFIVLCLGVHVLVMYWCCKSEKIKHWVKKFSFLKLAIVFCLLILLFFSSSLFYGYEHFMLRSPVLEAGERVPLFVPITIRGTMKRMGFRPPDVTILKLHGSSSKKGLKYPANPIVRDPERKKYNILWLVGESWRADAFNPEVMPAASAFSAAHGVRFVNHYSGGNGTRIGMFSMFYGIYGNYWHDFLKNTRGALFIDWLLEDGYDIRCFTSAKFSYPEFDHTIFAKVPADRLFSDDAGRTWSRDQRNTERLLKFLQSSSDKTPFMAFMFFESPHAPYEFPQESIVYPDYAKNLNYALLSAKDGPQLKKRYYNSCRHLDMCLRKIFTVLEAKKLLNNTIIVLTGDHGEEFFEKGHLGHNSTYSEEQIRPPLMLYIPGVSPRIYSGMSSHLDIVPMLAPYFEIKNPASDYSLGKNLLDPSQKREYTILADWSTVAFVNSEYKIVLPDNITSFALSKLTDNLDREIKNRDQFYRKNAKLLFEIQKDLVRFNN